MTLALAPRVARGDGDPASDVLATQNLFLPAGAGVSALQQAQLEAVLTVAAHSGYHVRLAVIASAADLGSVTALWRRPRNYAQFLGEELSLGSNARVLVAMPDGFGLYETGGTVPAEQAAVLNAQPAGGTGGLGAGALAAVESLAQASGHRIPSAVVAAVQGARTNAGSGDALVWGVFGAGAALIVVAWGASLRARPLWVRAR